MKISLHQKLSRRERRVRRRIDKTNWSGQSPMIAPPALQYELADRVQAMTAGGLGVMQELVRQLDLAETINRTCPLFKLRLPYSEADHVLNIAYNLLAGGTCLEHLELRRLDEAYLHALGAERIPDPTTAGDFCRRFTNWNVFALVIHVANAHYVSRNDFAADLRNQFVVPIPDDEIDVSYSAFLDDVQTEQIVILCDLIQERGIRGVYVEGVTEANVERFRAKVDELRGIDLDDLERRLNEADEEIEQMTLLVEIDTYRAHMLQIGAVGRLMMAGTPVDVIPLDDAEIMEAADPSKLGWRFDTPENSAREAEMVRRLLAGGPVSVVVLGSAHDLRDELKAACPSCRLKVIKPERLDGVNSVGE